MHMTQTTCGRTHGYLSDNSFRFRVKLISSFCLTTVRSRWKMILGWFRCSFSYTNNIMNIIVNRNRIR